MVMKDWHRKNFSDFDYLTIEPETRHIVWAFVVTLIVNLIVTLIVIKNEVTEDGYY